MLRVLVTLLSLAAGVALGLGLTLRTTGAQPPFGAMRGGAWTVWPTTGTPAADPYARALAARTGRLPLASAAGLRFFATRDGGGMPLDGLCGYEVSGPTPPAQFWTLTVLGADGQPRPSPDVRQGLTSSELVRGANGAFRISVARQARPGNWLPTRGDGPFQLMLSIYDTPAGAALQNGGPLPPLPIVERVGCP